ncbi:MAG: hypothetical protein AAF367_11220 [Pseudomonadota bacterium]
MIRHLAELAALTLAAAVFIWAPAKAGDVMVIDSTMAALPPGEMVPEAEVITVPDGARLTLITPAGETRVLDGPFSGPIGTVEQSGGSSFTDFTTGRGRETKVLGAVRAPSWELGE